MTSGHLRFGRNRRRLVRAAAAMLVPLAFVVAVAGCSSRSGGGDTRGKVVLLTYDSFTPSKGVFDEFTRRTGYRVEVVTGGDTGEMVNKAILTKNRPVADAVFGIDSSFIARAVDEGLFAPYRPSSDAVLDPALRLPDDPVVPVDRGDVCVNWDIAGLAARNVAPPATLADLADPEYRGLLVVENPASSGPGLSFMLATIAAFGEDGWLDFWRTLRANDVLVTDGWESAYNVEFSGGAGKGPRPLVVSYATSPVAEVVFGEPRPDSPPTGSMTTGCFRSVEYAGILANASEPKGAAMLVDFLTEREFQADLPLTLFVYPANTQAPLPDEYRFAAQVTEPLSLPPTEIAANRDRWIDEWTRTVLR